MVSRRSVATHTVVAVAPRALVPSGSGTPYPHGGGTRSALYPPQAMADVVMSVTQRTNPPRVVSLYSHSDLGTERCTGTGESSPDLR